MKQLVDVLAVNEIKDTSHNRTTLSNENKDLKDNSNMIKIWEKKVNKHDPDEIYSLGITEMRF